ncbi:potassium channel family protein [Nocardioides sp. GY 10113]|uniref:potassium channel family protein n=1 Tax=Nocardioides sp. GY 10113 TaxID=2569761 RepID=UPI00145910B9|nr:potassium channel family protein [Nocardioides sp. GY 10113]
MSIAVTPPENRYLDRFGAVLLVVLATVCAQALIDVRDEPVWALFSWSVSGLALVLAVRAGGVRKRWRRAADVVVVVSLASNALLVGAAEAFPAVRSSESIGLLWLVTAALVPVAVARRVLRHRHVTVATVLGAVAAYVQIAVAYSLILQALDTVTSGHLFGEEVSTTVYTYASLETITTLGYGDYTATTDLGRLILVSEALVGQVYLVVFVALIVSRFPVPSADDEAAD